MWECARHPNLAFGIRRTPSETPIKYLSNRMPMGASEADMIDVMERAVLELDDVLGDRVSAMVISGSMIPPRRGVRTQEGPQFLTSRVLVSPMVRVLGYTDVTLICREIEHIPGLVIATVPVNHPLSDAVGSVLGAMHREGIPTGVATDGMRWMLAETERERSRVVCMSDLRPYYIEVLDRRRFRVAVMEDRRNLMLFSHLFSNPSASPLSAGRSVGGPDPGVIDDRRVEPVPACEMAALVAVLHEYPSRDVAAQGAVAYQAHMHVPGDLGHPLADAVHGDVDRPLQMPAGVLLRAAHVHEEG